jgi:hypothetical protein
MRRKCEHLRCRSFLLDTPNVIPGVTLKWCETCGAWRTNKRWHLAEGERKDGEK